MSQQGHCLGTLCVIDDKPRTFSPEQKGILQGLAHRVMTEMELRKAGRRLRDTHDHIKQLFNALSDGVVVVDAKGCVVFLDDKAEPTFDLGRQKAAGQPWEDVLDVGSEATSAIRDLLAGRRPEPIHLSVERINRSMEVRKATVPDRPGEVALLISDVTELNQMRSMLRGDNRR